MGEKQTEPSGPEPPFTLLAFEGTGARNHLSIELLGERAEIRFCAGSGKPKLVASVDVAAFLTWLQDQFPEEE